MQPEARRRSLRAKIITWSFVPAAIILTAVALVTYYAYQRVTEDLVVERDQELTRLTASELAVSLQEYPDLLAVVAREFQTLQDDSARQQAALAQVSHRLVLFDTGVIVLNNLGQVVAAEPPRPDIIGQDWSTRPYFRQLVGSIGQPVFSNILPDGPASVEVIAMAVPILTDRGEFLGAMVGMFRLGATSLSPFYGTLLRLRLDNKGDAYVVDGNGRIIFASDPDQAGSDFAAHPISAEALSLRSGAVRTRAVDGRDILASFGAVPNSAWSLVVEENWADLTQASLGYGPILLALLALGVVIPAIVVAVGVRRITGPIADLVEASREVAEGRFGRTVSAHTGDELEELARQFNRMSAELQASYTELERRVEERTRELATLLDVSRNVASTLELKPLLGLILDQLQSVLDYTGATIFMLEDDQLTVLDYRGPLTPERARQLRFRLSQAGVNRAVIEGRAPLIIDDVRGESELAHEFQKTAGADLATRFGYIRSWLGVPLMIKEWTIGMLSIDHSQPGYFTARHAGLALALASQAAIAIENARLYEQAQQLAALEERQKLARELHDSVSQALYGIALGARTARTLLERDPSKVSEPIDYVLSLAEAGLAEMRALIFELRPESLESEGLVAALAKQAAFIRARHAVEVETSFCNEPPLPLEVKTALYRIAQEALHNVVKHARATRIDLRLACAKEEGTLTLQVQDDGRGFDTDASFPGHLGLHSMRERAEKIGGRLDVRSASGQGTRVYMIVNVPTDTIDSR